jgi:hypothetical protein
MADHLSIEILGLVRGAADGPLAITMLAAIVAALIAIPATIPRCGGRVGQPTRQWPHPKRAGERRSNGICKNRCKNKNRVRRRGLGNLCNLNWLGDLDSNQD